MGRLGRIGICGGLLAVAIVLILEAVSGGLGRSAASASGAPQAKQATGADPARTGTIINPGSGLEDGNEPSPVAIAPNDVEDKWGESAAAMTGLRFMKIVPEDMRTAVAERLEREKAATVEELGRQSSLTKADDAASARLIAELCKYDAIMVELALGRAVLVENGMPTSVPDGHEIMLLGGWVSKDAPCSVLFLFPKEKYEAVGMAAMLSQELDLVARVDFLASFNARELSVRRATLQGMLDVQRARSALLHQYQDGKASREQLKQPSLRIDRLPGFSINVSDWTLRMR